MKKIKSFLIIMLFVLFPSTVFASSGSSSIGIPLGIALRNRSIYFNTYVIFCINAIIKDNFQRKLKENFLDFVWNKNCNFIIF